MGLDMYLEREVYVGGHWDHNASSGGVDITITVGENVKHIKIPARGVKSVVCPFACWRKANAIHNWFVQNVQGGEDNCARYWVSREQLEELRLLCEARLKDRTSEGLEPVDGFFFGSTEVDEYYFDDLESTVRQLSDLPDDGDFYYQASW